MPVTLHCADLMAERFPQKRIFITGAGSGLGLAIAQRYASAGWRVAVTDIDAERASAGLEAVRANGGDGFAAVCDVRSVDQLHDVATRLRTDWGGVDIVVNNAGVACAGSVADFPLEDWDWVLDINLMGVVRGCHVFGPLLQRQGAGHIVNIASLAGIALAPAMAGYNVAKIGVIGLSESMRAELAGTGVGVSVVCPSFFRTNLMESMRSPDQRLQHIAEKLVNESSARAADVADYVYRHVRKQRFMILPHADARWFYRLKRFSPRLFAWLLSRQGQAFLGRPGKGATAP